MSRRGPAPGTGGRPPLEDPRKERRHKLSVRFSDEDLERAEAHRRQKEGRSSLLRRLMLMGIEAAERAEGEE
jgi:hypothetical protein